MKVPVRLTSRTFFHCSSVDHRPTRLDAVLDLLEQREGRIGVGHVAGDPEDPLGCGGCGGFRDLSRGPLDVVLGQIRDDDGRSGAEQSLGRGVPAADHPFAVGRATGA